MKQFSFQKNKRLNSNKQFKVVLSHRKNAADGLLKVYAARNNLDYSRLGILVKKSCGSAVVRNRLKRLLREVFRQNQDIIQAGFDYVVMILPRWQQKINDAAGSENTLRLPSFEQIKNSFLALADKNTKPLAGNSR